MSINPTDIIKPAQSVLSSESFSGTLSDAWQAVIGDRVAAWRLTNAAKTQVKVNKQFSELGLKPNNARIPERFAITWFEEASKQDEDEIQELFARLLAQASSGQADALDRRNLEIVTRLTPNDAALFVELAEGGWGAIRSGQTYYWKESGHLFSSKPTKVDLEKFARSFEYLITVGILARTTYSEKTLNNRLVRGSPQIETNVESIAMLTETGLSLYRALYQAAEES